MAKRHTNRRRIAAVALIVVVVGAVATTAVAQSQRFPDVPPDHPAYEAVEWAADVGLTLGYGDGTFQPEQPLSRWHAVVFMERFYDDILGAHESEDFTRGDMMLLLKAIHDGSTARPSAWTIYRDGSLTIAETSNEAGFFLQGRCADTGRWSIRLGHEDSHFSFVETADPLGFDLLTVYWQFGSKARRLLFDALISRPTSNGQPSSASNLVSVSGDVFNSDLSGQERFLLDAKQDTSGTLDVSTADGDLEHKFSFDVTGSDFVDTLQVCVDKQA